MTRHTPGTWAVKPADTYAAQVVAQVPRPRGTREVTICRVTTPDSHADYDMRRAQARANARLLAAAPRLLKALGRFADSTIYGVLSDAGRAGDFRPLFDEMRTALEAACEDGAWRDPAPASSGGSTAPALLVDHLPAKPG